MSTPAGWYPDPKKPDQFRYWDGENWGAVGPPIQKAPQLRRSSTDTCCSGMMVAVFAIVLLVAIIIGLSVFR